MAIDPICGMEVDEAHGLRAERDGRTYYFCCEHCRRKFLSAERAPHAEHRKSKASPETKNLEPGTATRAYFCPMCAGVESDGPGACPRCGMALEPTVAMPGQEADERELRDMRRRFWVALALGLPVLVLAMGGMVAGGILHRVLPAGWTRWLQLVLTTPVVWWAGWPFFQRAARALAQWRLNMFTLIALGIGAAYGFSAVATVWPAVFPEALRHHGEAPLYFEAAAMITVLVLLGQVLELRARRQTGAAIRALLNLAPPVATVLQDGAEQVRPLAEVRVGDLLRVRPGERVPVDGRIMDGHASVDTAALTGEPMPQDKGPGDAVAAGMVNLNGTLVVRAEKVGRDTLLARIISLVAEAQRSRAPIQRVADRLAGWFVPGVVAVAIVTFALWLAVGPEPRLTHALLNAVAVLIIACPCALGLATPMAVMVGVGRGAQAGVLIRNAEVLERLAQVDTLVIDKTGTLTEGRPTVSHVEARPPFTPAEVLACAAAVEQYSEHPLARAIVAHARATGLAIGAAADFRAEPGGGVIGRVNGQEVRVGRAAFMGATGLTSAATGPVGGEPAGSVVYVSVDGRPAGRLILDDAIKATTPEAVSALHRLGLRLVMLTGDSRATAARVAAALGIDEVVAEVMPDEKLRRVRALREGGRITAMAGDGINDAPALAEADVGIAMGTGTDAAMETAGITLVQGDLRGIVKAVLLSRAVLRNIRQNLFWALAYNTLSVPIAAGVLYPWLGILLSPMLAAAAMSFSSLSVVANALRLRRLRL